MKKSAIALMGLACTLAISSSAFAATITDVNSGNSDSHEVKGQYHTDGAASNNQLNMFTEMGRAALLHKLAGKNPTVTTAQEVLDMANEFAAALTAAGAEMSVVEPIGTETLRIEGEFAGKMIWIDSSECSHVQKFDSWYFEVTCFQ